MFVQLCQLATESSVDEAAFCLVVWKESSKKLDVNMRVYQLQLNKSLIRVMGIKGNKSIFLEQFRSQLSADFFYEGFCGNIIFSYKVSLSTACNVNIDGASFFVNPICFTILSTL